MTHRALLFYDRGQFRPWLAQRLGPSPFEVYETARTRLDAAFWLLSTLVDSEFQVKSLDPMFEPKDVLARYQDAGPTVDDPIYPPGQVWIPSYPG